MDEDNVDITQPLEGKPPEVPISSTQPPIFERVAVAYALAQSVRLGSLELRIDRSIDQSRSLPDSLASTGQVSLSSKKVAQMIGELFVLRNQANLETDILETPEVFWDYVDYEPLYLKCREYLDVDSRVSILNQRAEVLQDLFDVLEDELNERHDKNLEWVVIILCALEALTMAVRFYIRFMRSRKHVLLDGSEFLNSTGNFTEDAMNTTDSLAVLPVLGPICWCCRTLVWPAMLATTKLVGYLPV